MKYIFYLLIMIPSLLFAQEEDDLNEDLDTETYIIIAGDSIPKSSIMLSEVTVLPKLEFENVWETKKYLILRRKTLKVYPYAKLAADRLETLNKRLELLDKKSDKKAYAKKIQKYVEDEFTEELKKLTRTEGQILVKLIYRQTGKTTFDLIKQLRSGWRAFWFNATANMFSISLKETYNPIEVKEDYLIEDILLRYLSNDEIKGLKTALKFNYFEAHNKWSKQE